MLDIVFEDCGYQVVHAGDAAQAMEAYRKQEIGVSLIDISMPGKDGLQLLRDIRRYDPAAVAILMTASDSKEQVMEALRSGAFDYIEKPFEEDDLRSRVAAAFKERDRLLQMSGGLAIKPEEIEQNAIERRKLSAEVRDLTKQLADCEAKLQQWQQDHRDAEKRLAEVEIKEGALKNLEAALHERLQKLKNIQPQPQRLTRPPIPLAASAGVTREEIDRLENLAREMDEREANFKEREQYLSEREQFMQQSEESLFEKGQRLQEWESELEQLREDMEKQGATEGLSPEGRAEIESMREELRRKEDELSKMEQRLYEKEKSLRKADRLVKVREEYLAL